jgi:hypothetical protein
MAETIGLLVFSAVATAGGPTTILGLSATASATLVGSAVIIGATVGATYLLTPEPEQQDVGKNELSVKQAVPARFIDVGRVKSGGVVFFYEAALDEGLRWSLYVGKVISCSEITEIETVFLNDAEPAWSGSYQDQSVAGAVPYGDNLDQGTYTALETARGLSTDVQPTLLTTAFGWGADGQLAGLAYSLARFGQGDDGEMHANLYPGGPPSVMCVIKGCAVPDPTTGVDMADLGTWTYSDNAARCILRYLLDTDGWKLSASDVDQTSFETAAAWCDETVSGEARYRIWGRYHTTDERRQVLQEMLAACDGQLIEQSNGKIALVVGRLVASNITLTDEDILEATFEPFGDTLDRVGSVRPRITREASDWQEYDLEPVVLPSPDSDQAVKQVDLPLKYCPSDLQAARLAGARLRQLNPRWRGTIVAKLRALQAYGDRWITVQFAPLGIDQQFEVLEGIALNVADFTCTMKLRSVESDDYDWGDD